MVKSIEELKALILWCKQEKVLSIKLDNCSFEISSMGLIEDMVTTENAILNEDSKNVIQKDLIEEDLSQSSDDEDLYWSTRG
jgi:hypothetical protein